MKIVLQKFIAESGYCSRRQAEELIRQKKVLVNGKLAELGMKVDGGDEVKIGKQKLSLSKEKIYIILNKPKGYTCTNRQFIGEKNVFDLVKNKERLFTVGRLDKDSRGLILLTNDGDLALKLTHPKYEHEKEYIVTITNYELPARFASESVAGRQITNDKIMKRIRKGIDIGGGDGTVRAKDIRYIGDNKFKIILTEGKKRQIRRMFKGAGCEIIDLVRVRIGNIKLENLAEGKFKYLTKKEIKN
jgi:pseudouridine synthase